MPSKACLLLDVETLLGDGLVSLALLEEELKEGVVVEVGGGGGTTGQLSTDADLIAAL